MRRRTLLLAALACGCASHAAAPIEARVREEPLTLGRAWPVPALLTLPDGAGPHPALVLVAGFGPSDRDGTVGPNKPLRDLAHGLARRGVATLRYDKRTLVHERRLARELGERLTLEQESVEDALDALATLRAGSELDPTRLYALGHSLGAAAVARVAARDAAVRGFVVMAGATRPLEDVVLAQMRYLSGLDGALSAEEEAVLAKLERQAASVKALHDREARADELPLGVPAAYWRDLERHPTAALLTADRRPLLVLHAERDYQVTQDDWRGWERALATRPEATLRRFAGLNHLFMPVDGPSTPLDYQRPGHVAAEVIEAIAAWVRAR